MKHRQLITFFLFLDLLLVLVMLFPEFMISPGELTAGHHAMKKQCLECHTPFKGATSAQCIRCHKPDEIGVRNVAGRPLPPETKPTALLHRGLAGHSCLGCHTDHKGTDTRKATLSFDHRLLAPALLKKCVSCHEQQAPKDPLHRNVQESCGSCHRHSAWKPALFDHEMLSSAIARDCAACHKAKAPSDAIHRGATLGCIECHSTKKWKPATFDHAKYTGKGARQCVSCHVSERPNDALHKDGTLSCSECHSTKKWKPATFDHAKYTGKGARQCVSCHVSERPNDALHRDASASCGTCHSTKKWKPATFDHDRYFRLDGDHRASCRTCHTDAGNYSSYTCYGCHEHTRAGIAAEHIKEGIRNFGNCVKCHRSSSERRGGEGHGERGDD